MPPNYAAVFEHVPIAMCVSDQQKVELCNAAASKLFGYTPRNFIGLPIALFWPPLVSPKETHEKVFIAIGNSGCYSEVRTLRLANDKLFWCRTKVALYDECNRIRRYIWTFQKVETTLKVVDELPPREQQIAVALVVGKTSKTIAQDVGLSIRTIEYYRKRLMRRLDVANYKELVRRLTIGTT